MKLFNITLDLKDKPTILKPYIPFSAAEDEDRITPRVCLSSNITGCLQAIGNRYIAVGEKFILRTVNINTNSKYLITPEKLKNTNKVPDALENKEYWYLKEIECTSTMLRIDDFDFDFDLAWSLIAPKDYKKIILNSVNELDLSKCNTSKEMYDTFSEYTNEKELYNEQDEVWDNLAELPWAQKISIYNLKLKVLES